MQTTMQTTKRTATQAAMLQARFGIEIEMTGITRAKAAGVVARFFGTTVAGHGSHLDERVIRDRQGRAWKICSDSSIRAKKKAGGRLVDASQAYRCELVSPPLTYDADMGQLQELVRALRKAGAVSSGELSCGIHIHLDGAPHTARSLSNFVKIIAAREDLLYDALDFGIARRSWCKKTDAAVLERLAGTRRLDMGSLRAAWYGDGSSHARHYDASRYHWLNLHSFFQEGGNRTVELRGFNGTMHAGEIRAYVALALALNHQALTQRGASARPCQMENPKFAMRTWLNRIGLSGEEFKNCRNHLVKHLAGSAAWRYGRTA